MATITPDTFDPLRRYVAVRLQQGVVIVDADENEREDIRRFELRAFLKWFVGDGVPDGNDGFRIEGTNLSNDFVIRRGVPAAPGGAGNVEVGLRHVGRCLVDGLDVMINADVNFSGQPLHAGQPGSAALSAALGVPQVAALTTPGASHTLCVYLDVWHRLVTPSEDPTLVHPGLGTESCARFKREWVVRTRVGLNPPQPGNADFIAGHSYCRLALIARPGGAAQIAAEQVADRREKALLMLPSYLINDLFGVSAAQYRRGDGRPLLNLRQAVNALLHGEVPADPETALAPSPTDDDNLGRGLFFLGPGLIANVFDSNRAGGVAQVFAHQFSPLSPQAAAAPQQVTTGVAHQRPHAVLLGSTGQVLVAYETQTTASNEDIHMKRATFAGLNTGLAEIPVATDGGIRQRAPFIVPLTDHAVVIWHENTTSSWQFRRYSLATNNFPNPKATLGGNAQMPTTPFDLHAARDHSSNVWVAYRDSAVNSDIRTLRLPPNAGPTAEVAHNSGFLDTAPFVLADDDDAVWFFWASINGPNGSIRYRRFVHASATWEPALAQPPATLPGTETGLNNSPAAIYDTDGGIWLFFTSNRSGSDDVWLSRLNPGTSIWGAPRQITGTAATDKTPFALKGAEPTISLVWNRLIGTNDEIFFRRIFTSI